MAGRHTSPGAGARHSSGFTLIELLVVVAIIALLISILLPSLSKARSQARTTLCSCRVSQMVKAILIYSDDYEQFDQGEGPGRATGGRVVRIHGSSCIDRDNHRGKRTAPHHLRGQLKPAERQDAP
jgi:prepilin-type N-terminal cleavage/methylation domain-containing protein